MNKVIEFFDKNHLPLAGKRLVIATSGGPDSVALVDMLYKLKHEYDFEIIVAHFDHKLRKDSGEETNLLKKYCLKRDLPFENGIWMREENLTSGVEAAAREARYDFLVKTVHKFQADYLLTAHHGDDLLENILLKFIRSGNPNEMNSLKAIGEREGIPLLRPLLSFSKQELLEYDRIHGLDFIEDETNNEDETMRNRLRHHVVPLLKEENPNLVHNALRFSENLDILVDLSDQKIEQVGMPEQILGKFYRIRLEKLNNLSKSEQAYFWQSFIWKKWHRRVGNEFKQFTLMNYQSYWYLWRNKDVDNLSGEKIKDIKLDIPFDFYGQKIILSKNPDLNNEKLGDFWSSEKEFKAGTLPAGSKLLLKNGHHAKAKKMFAEAGIPLPLRKYCLSIFTQEEQPIFIEKTYENQTWDKNKIHYYLYRLKFM
ncbi:tRNA(Ile)-lysidine synthase [Lactobacillus hamsteri DSM 5661 = JCM 6256]|uniref:tRNA(Ile)-lysidine synthase n=1 Tax=Lactobacillus hamsteri DSM 5661 = JCM 6256 TaxID=1423754 RepID=A0A0R1YGC0_9LACO|nr:tRNA lysidine(34) synthetase TilS [Lactobacillus hamsteri]KRM41013.1 tRNA(Ile)-lysidine synthase [Lactobacillus hamsteri DSM 5661 = JCM 6256]